MCPDTVYVISSPVYQTPYNPYGVGHMVNHPPRFTEPNVMQVPSSPPYSPLFPCMHSRPSAVLSLSLTTVTYTRSLISRSLEMKHTILYIM